MIFTFSSNFHLKFLQWLCTSCIRVFPLLENQSENYLTFSDEVPILQGQLIFTVRTVLLTQPSGYSESYSSSSRWFVWTEPFPHIVVFVTDSLPVWWCGYTHSLTVKQGVPFRNKLVYVESKSVVLASNWTGPGSDVV